MKMGINATQLEQRLPLRGLNKSLLGAAGGAIGHAGQKKKPACISASGLVVV